METTYCEFVATGTTTIAHEDWMDSKMILRCGRMRKRLYKTTAVKPERQLE
ncbi:MAG: hypothetical protein NTZ35_13795 [Ignavibacteriales bacterium]|nr:hypothetical protein [Ignavibacteriales bacterium]